MFNISADFDRAERMLSDLARKQLPFATAMALNDTATDVKEAEEREIERVFDRPTNYTKRAVYVRRASKTRLTATVGIKNVQAGYLKRQVTGGTRKPKGRALVVPVKARLNRYGNIPKGGVARLKGRKNVFVASQNSRGAKHLPGGIYQRQGRKGAKKLKMLIAFEPRATYRKRYGYGPVALKIARARFSPHFVEWVRRSLLTVR